MTRLLFLSEKKSHFAYLNNLQIFVQMCYKNDVTRTWLSINVKVVKIQHPSKAFNLNSQTHAIFSNTKSKANEKKPLHISSYDIFLIRN